MTAWDGQMRVMSTDKCTCRLPGDVQDPQSFWDLLLSQRLARAPFPPNRFNAAAFYNLQKGRPGTIRYNQGYCIANDLGHFDAGFFNINPSDVLSLDPQQRQLLECCFECLESGGVTLDDVSDTMTGVYIGNFACDYETLASKEPERIEGMAVLGMGRTTISNRVSYLYNLHGPSVTMDTACSSTLYALHFAVQALRNREIPAAFVGGVNLILTLEYHLAIGQIGALSPTAQCHAFDASADGYSRGEAINVLYLKRVSDAIRDGDPIRAVIRGSSLTANGKNNGITLPSALAQELAIRKAYEHSGPLDYNTVGYLECHGTGTPAGDPIETTAIANVFGKHREWFDPLYIGSTKPQVGHGEACSAITSVIKVVLAMENGIIPGTIGIKKLNPALNLKGGSLAVITQNTPWPEGKAKRASVNSSGYGGANGHVVIDGVDEYFKSIGWANPAERTPTFDPYTIVQKRFLLPVTGHDEYSLRQSLANITDVLHRQTHDFHELLYTMTARRTRFSHRAIIPVEMSQKRSLTLGEPVIGRASSRTPVVAFVFTGQGAQWAEMGRHLLESYPVVQRTFRKLNLALSRLKQRPTWSLEEILLAPAEKSKIGDVSFSQPICTAIQIAMIDLLQEWGIRPEATVGHSSGELAAAYAAKLITAQEAIIAAYLRGVHATLTQAPGTMMAVAMSASAAENLLAEYNISTVDAVVACVNSPQSVTLSGQSHAIDALYRILKEQSILCKKLATGGKAYHSPSMKEVGSGYSEAILEATANEGGPVRLLNGDRPVMVSSVTVKRLQPGDIDGSYWQRNLESPVLFDAAMKHLLSLKFGEERHVDCLIEIGPHSALKGPINQIIASPEVQEIWKMSLGTAPKVTYEHTLERGHNAEEDMMRLATSMFIKGYPINLLRVNGQRDYRPSKIIIDLPKYPWNHQTKQPLMVNRATQDYKFATHPRHDLIGTRLPGGNRMEPVWRNYLRLDDVPWIKDHVIGSVIIVPGAAYLAMAVEAAAQFAEDTTLGGPPFDFEDAKFHLQTVTIKAALVLPASGTADIMINLRPSEASAASNRLEFKICSVAEGRWIEHAEGIVTFELMHGAKTAKVPFNNETEEPVFEQTFSKETWYERLKYRGFDFGPRFRVIDEIQVLLHASRARAKAPILQTAEANTTVITGESRYAIHPLTIDAVLQGRVASVYTSRADQEEATQIPVFIEEMTISPSAWAKDQTGLIDSVAWTEGARSGGSHSTLTTHDGFEIISARNVKWRQFENQGSQEKMMNKDTAREPYYRMHWKPDIDFLDTAGAHDLYHSDFKSPSGAAYLDEVHHIRTRLETVTVLYVCGALEMVRPEELSTEPVLKWTHGFYNWMCHVKAEAAAGRMVLCEPDATSLNAQQREQRIAQLLAELSADFPQLEFNAIFYRNMVEIMHGTVASIDLAVQAEILARVYADGSIHDAARKNLASVVDILAHKNPTMRVLEVGAGTGSCTSVALDVLNAYDMESQHHHAKRYHDYTFTDISPAFFEKAEELFSAYPPMIYKTFDLTQDPASQGFELGTYDLILASNVMHAPGNTDRLLHNCSRLLKPGGRLVMLEITQTGSLTPVQFAFGTLPSFWECLDDVDADRPFGPFRTLSSWEQQLKVSGFTGLDMVLTDFPEPLALESVMVASTHSSSSNAMATSEGKQSVIIVHSPDQDDLAQAVEKDIKAQGKLKAQAITHCSLDSVPVINNFTFSTHDDNIVYIVLEEVQTPVLMDMQPAQFDGLKRLVSSASSILWVTGGDLMAGQRPAMAMAHGINTVLMNEHSTRNLRFAVLDIDDPSTSQISKITRAVTDVCSTVATAASRVTCETDFMLKDGVLRVCRVVPDMQLNQEFTLDTGGEGRLEQVFPTSGNVQLALETPGLLDTVYFREKPTCDMALGPDEIEIEVKAVGLNMKDYVIAMGNFESVKSSNESTGIVARVGSKVTHLRPGDKVICLERGHYDTFLRSPAQKCVKLDANADLVAMATVGIAHGTALYALNYLARLEANETVHIGAEIYATVGTQRKKDYLITECGIPADHIFWSRSLGFKDALLQQTGDRGVDVILSTISGPGFHESLKCLAPCGRFIDVGRGNVLDRGNMGLHAFNRSISFFSFDLNSVLDEKPKMAQQQDHRTITPITLDKTFHITEMESALRYFGQGQHIGKVVLTYGPTANKVTLKGPLQPRGIDGTGSYLLAGCHGGLGHSMADSLIERGAKNLVFLGRSSETKQEIASFCKRVRSQGVNVVTVQGDVSKMEDVERAVTHAISMGPLRGIVHAAMVLQDAFFDPMTLDQFNMAVRPKVHGALNLHQASVQADAQLDFFFMTSSAVTYVGHISQANYAAANAVLDNLVRQRIRLGLPVATVSLGPIKGVGTLRNRPEYAENLLRSGLIEAEESEFIRHFERFTTHPQPASTQFDPLTQGHILTGVEYSKHDLSMVQVTRIEQDRRSALLVTTLESRKAAAGGMNSHGDAAADGSVDDRLLADLPDDRDQALIVLAEAIGRRLAKLLFIPPDEIDISRPFSHFGLDSMSGSELIHWLSQRFGLGMSFLQLLAPSCTPKSLAVTVLETVQRKAANSTQGADSSTTDKAHGHDSNGVNVNGDAPASSISRSDSIKTNGANPLHQANGRVKPESRLDRFAQKVRMAIADPKPVTHSYVCMVINQKGEQVYTLNEGMMSPESPTRVDLNSVYEMASLSKSMTTVGVMICVERGQISLDDDVAFILPDLCALPVLDGVDEDGQCRTKPRTKPITLRLLMTHRAGCGYHESPGLTRWARQNGKTNSTFDSDFEVMKTYPLVFEPGEGWLYGSGIDWAGELVARINHTTLEEFLRTNLWEPLGMASTTFHPELCPGMMDRIVPMYERTDDQGLTPRETLSRIPARHDCGGHGVWSTPEDWGRFMGMMLAEGAPVLSAASMDEIFRPQTTDVPELHALLSGPLRASLLSTIAMESSNIEIALGGPVYMEDIPGKRSAGTLQWAGRPNIFWWIDRTKGVAATTFAQVISPADTRFAALTSALETAVYAELA
ncbi:hypothetical protein ASPZODRAFT_160532 [Penicilliopsis zonata CBS 506.65]|uniref:Uncharacterized protein n=1 Tax=Penicilliopsis zonata CBS 506.65 TaxID=1073090 RepID=A0A1L9SD70_9EURO|nr:hypothetical protein ASPZODRAFT_160532 [Penicilliopsis zonata CBS 506.65]OJJ45037.1 hypothetical protein ASPZODRAFT_160532 [Penicilliopsis zonata CBS 506.65]